MAKATKLSIQKKPIIIAAICLIVLCGIIVTHRDLWFFSPAYSQRQTTNQFFGYISKNEPESAFNLTSVGYQSNTSYSYFLSQLNKINGNKMSVTFVAYATSKTKVAITGYINDKTINEKLDFAINLVPSKKGPKIDSIVISASN